MNRLKLQHLGLGFIFLWLVVATAWVFLGGSSEEAKPIEIVAPSEEIAARENVQSRREYEIQRQADPATGEIPADIRKKELAFAKELYRQQLNNLPRNAAGSNAVESSEALDWTSVGPGNFGGRTRALAMDVTDENILLAGGVSGGMWRSENRGQTWTKTTEVDELQSVTAIVQDTRAGKENTWYYGTGELVGNSTRAAGAPFRGEGMFKSTDGGRSWQALSATRTDNPAAFDFPFNYVWDLAINPNATDDEVYAAIFGGIVRSTDGGQSWTTVLGQDLLNLGSTDLNDVTSVFYTDIHVTTDGTFYATLSSATNNDEELSQQGGFYQSTDGVNWRRISSAGSRFFRRTEIGSSPSNPEIVYFITDGQDGHVLRRYDAVTETIVELNTVPNGSNDIETFESQSSYDLYVRVHPTDENLVFLGGTNIYRSTNGFTSRNGTAWIGGYDPNAEGVRIYPNHHPDQHDLIFIPSFPNAAISANDGGLFFTPNITAAEVEWSPLNNGYITTQYYTGYVSRFASDNFVFGGLQDNGSIVTDLGAPNANNSNRIISGDGSFAASTRFGIYYYMSFQRSQVLRLTWNENLQLTSFAGVQPLGAGTDPSQPYLFINPFTLDPNNGNRMYLAGGDFLWRNRNLSQIPSGSQDPTSFNWARLDNTEITEGQISTIEVSTEPKNFVFFGTTNGQVFKIENAHSDEYSVSNITSTSFPEGANVSSIAVNPVDASEVMVIFSNYNVQSVFYSTDGGTTFTDVSGNLEENPDGSGNGPSVRWARIVPKADGSSEYFLATSTGVYSTASLSGNVTWELEGAATLGNAVVNMIDFRRSDGRIVAATHGRGLFVSAVQNVVPLESVSAGSELTIQAPFPNPFEDEVTLRFNLPETDFVFVRIYSSSGQLVRVLSRGLGFQGDNEIFWDGKNSIGNPVPNGTYLVRFTYNQTNQARRIILNRN